MNNKDYRKLNKILKKAKKGSIIYWNEATGNMKLLKKPEDYFYELYKDRLKANPIPKSTFSLYLAKKYLHNPSNKVDRK